MDPEIEQVPVQTTDQRPHARAPSLPSEVIVLDESNSSQPAQREGALDNLEEALENACETLNTISETVIKFSFDSQHILFGKMYVSFCLSFYHPILPRIFESAYEPSY